MTGAIVVENLLYIFGAVAGILVGALAVTLRHRRPTSIEAHVAEFHKGLAALAPGPVRGRRSPPVPVLAPRPPRTVRAVPPSPVPAPPPPAAPTVTEAETV